MKFEPLELIFGNILLLLLGMWLGDIRGTEQIKARCDLLGNVVLDSKAYDCKAHQP